jgi:hypothetical protein
MEQKNKFRIMVIERNDGVKIYYPQVFIPIDISYKKNFLGKTLKSELMYDWRSFMSGKDGLTTCDKVSDFGNGGSDISYAHEMIEQYKLDVAKRIEKNKLEKLEHDNKQTKSITFIEAETV